VIPARRCQVVLLSREPAAHAGLIAQLRGRGARVRIPRGAGGASRLFAAQPDFLLVDLIHGAGLTPDLVSRINRERAATVVFALHDGSLGSFYEEAADLSVEGFCHARDCRPLVRTIEDHRPLVSLALH
jgi:hypothetical protein